MSARYPSRYVHVTLDGNPHSHRAVLTHRRTREYRECLLPVRCNDAAHGGVEILDICRCGATRRANLRRRGRKHTGEYAPWVLASARPTVEDGDQAALDL